MTSFGTLFRELFKQKSKTTYLVFLIQLIAAIIFVIFGLISAGPGSYDHAMIAGVKVNALVAWILSIAGVFLGLSSIAQPVYLLMTSWRNEKINRSQTWRLVPMSNGKIYLCNTLSSFASFIYLAILQFLVALVVSGIVYLSSSDVRAGLAKGFSEIAKYHPGDNFAWLGLVAVFIAAILIGLFWYVIVSFYHFVSRAVIDFLPSANGFFIFVIRVVTLIVVIYLLGLFFNSLGNFAFDFVSAGSGNEIWYTDLLFLVADVLFGGLNYLLIEKFVEAKAN
ncbi:MULTISPECIES: ABC transporter permease [Lactobacillus]|uniref:ABC transporter permease n=1 Tax=Lactobacillus xujianguonis TaxID=2495899 RepID=A0A437SXQ2_9LACO|nr:MULTISPECIES: ABC transporter permease [Lactobacillus]RVU71714.1 ABC transporter permease [Lactobacillus xujianguonis]RVU77544.1 ABC transporter permease [Lactobacillus xujianguonis]